MDEDLTRARVVLLRVLCHETSRAPQTACVGVDFTVDPESSRPGIRVGCAAWNFFIYLIYHDFAKIYGLTQI
jgi:hypothetical protein